MVLVVAELQVIDVADRACCMFTYRILVTDAVGLTKVFRRYPHSLPRAVVIKGQASLFACCRKRGFNKRFKEGPLVSLPILRTLILRKEIGQEGLRLIACFLRQMLGIKDTARKLFRQLSRKSVQVTGKLCEEAIVEIHQIVEPIMHNERDSFRLDMK